VRVEASSFSVAEYRYVRDHARSFNGVVFEVHGPPRVSVDEQDRYAQFVSGNYFAVLGVQMVLGRGFSATQDRLEAPDAVVVLGHALWKAQYGEDKAMMRIRAQIHHPREGNDWPAAAGPRIPGRWR
jgi:hypothetical protein